MPQLSVIIPTFKRPKQLEGCLEALSKSEATSFEVVVVDDGSPVPVESVARAFEDRLTLTYIRQENAGPAAARNRGAREASGEILVFTDDDCLPEPNWLDELAAVVNSGDKVLAGGRTDNLVEGNIYSDVSQDLVSFLYEHSDAHEGGVEFFTSNNMACRAEHYVELGGFDETFPLPAAEDRDFGLRWHAAGGELIYAPQAVIGHVHKLDLSSFVRMHSNYGRGARHLRAISTDRPEGPVRFKGPGFYMSMLGHPFRLKRSKPFARAGLLALAQLATVRGAIMGVEQKKRTRILGRTSVQRSEIERGSPERASGGLPMQQNTTAPNERLGMVVNFFDGQSNPEISELLAATTALSLRLLKLNPVVDEILLVDGSGEPCAPMQRACEDLGVDYRHGGRKLNYVEAYNLGWRALDTPIIGMMANDIIPHPLDTIVRLKEWILKPDVGCSFPYLTTNRLFFDEVQRPTLLTRGMVTCEPSSMTLNLNLFKRELLEDMGGLDANYTVGFQEPIILIRLREMGYRCVMVGNARAMHYDSLTKTLDASETSSKRYDADKQRWFREYGPYASERGIGQLRLHKRPFATSFVNQLIWRLAYVPAAHPHDHARLSGHSKL